jgi:hypothetical protein
MRAMSILAIAVILAVSAWGQAVATAILSGTVKDPKGAVVPGATVTVSDPGKNFERSVTSGASGDYQILQLPPGRYAVTAEAKGFAKYSAKAVTLTVGETATLPITLSISTSETVEVNAQTELIETQRTSATNTVGQQRIDNLPINGRNYINFVLIDSQTARDDAPSIGAAPTSGINFGGQRARSNLVNLDGMDQEDNSVNGIRSTIPQEAVQEFQIIDNSYAPEYGRASGGVINIVSRGGDNNYHGSVYSYLRNRYIQATNPFSNVNQPAYTRVLPGFTFSGPIKKDRAFFFLSWEGTFRQETGFSSIGANNFGLVASDFSSLFGAPAGSAVFDLTPQQLAFISANLTNPAVAPLIPTYLGVAARASGAAVNGAWPLALASPTCPTLVTCFAAPDGVVPGTTIPTFASIAPVTSFVPLKTLVGNFPVKEHTNNYSARFDFKLTDNQQLMFRFNVTPSDVTGIEVDAENQTFGQNSFSRTSQRNSHDAEGTAQHTWTIGNNRVNEFRFQYARHGELYDFSSAPGGGNVAIDIPGFAFFGREPFSFVNRTEQRYEVANNFSWVLGKHNVKFGADLNYLPVRADFSVNFGGLYNFGDLSAAQVLGSINPGFDAFPGFSGLQAYGLGIPQVFIQGIGNPHGAFTNSPLGFFAQDSWRIRPNFTLNYGLRYDVEFSPTFGPASPIAGAAQNALGITKGIPRDTNNVAPRVGIAWDPWSDGKTVVRASYGLFYDHPLLALAFDSAVADGTQAPQIETFGSAPSAACGPLNFTATNLFQGIFNTSCFPGGNTFFGYEPEQQRFNSFLPNSIFTNQNYLTAGFPLIIQPFGYPVAKNFQYAYSEQGNLTIEHQIGKDMSFSIGYNFNGGHHLNRALNVNAPHTNLLVNNWKNALAAGDPSAAAGPESVSGCGINPLNGQPYVPAAVVSFFRPSGINPTLYAAVPAPCQFLIQSLLVADGLGFACNGGPLCIPAIPGAPGVPTGGFLAVPFSDMVAQLSNGNSSYNGLTASLRKRFGSHYEFLGSYTWSHTIDDSTDLQSLLEPQDNYNVAAERSNSTFDQRHRFVLSGIYQSGKIGSGSGFASHMLSNWTVAPIIEISSGRPFNILLGFDNNMDLSASTDRPNVVTSAQAAAPVPAGCLPAVQSSFSPTGFLQPPCLLTSSSLDGNLGRNAGTTPYTVFTDFRFARDFSISERVKLQGSVDMFNLINKFNVQAVDPLYTDAGTPTSAFDPRQFQFGLKLSF